MSPSTESGKPVDLGIDISQFTEVFFEEAGEHLANMESLLVAIGDTPPSDEDLNAIFRAAHSIKGGAAMFGFRDVTELTHDMESVLDLVRRHELPLTGPMIEAFLESRDLTAKQLAQHKAGTPGSPDAPEAQALRALLREFQNSKGTVAATPASAAVTGGSPYIQVRDFVLGLRSEIDTAVYREELARLTGRPEQTAPAKQDDSADLGYEIYDVETGPATVEQKRAQTVAAPVAPPAPSKEANAAAAPSRAANTAVNAESNSIRVAVEKVDALINMVGELVITQAMLQQRSNDLDPVAQRGFLNAMSDLERNTRSLQEAVMSIRMLPMSMVFNRFPRMVRDLAAKLGKKIELKLVGEATEVDKGMIEKIVDPLTHLVRNSMDHGIETPDKRMQIGKPAQGTVTLSAYHQGGSIIIEVSDDGAGLNREKILAKARERGMAIADPIADADAWQLIFEAGFSTADQITDVSGRGVGMDVVKRNITSLGGSIEIESRAGAGSTIRVRLPLTLAIMDGMSVAVGAETYIIPLGSIIESLQVQTAQVRTIANASRVVQVRSEYLQVVALRDVFQVSSSTKDESELMMVIVEAEGVKTALLVDELLGQHQVVVKNLEANYKKVHGVSAATIMGDGRVGFIVDVPALVRRTRH